MAENLTTNSQFFLNEEEDADEDKRDIEVHGGS